ncbi:TPA: hypothetical protein ACKQC7_004309 [Serratia marcescens]
MDRIKLTIENRAHYFSQEEALRLMEECQKQLATKPGGILMLSKRGFAGNKPANDGMEVCDC